ncbi:MAG: hypothetical protein CVU56_22615 [Deltaproteobacteria bacterium HGW-Deltaproteobacteria-14]|nr:MAG: hypothetical protein CVU56_22615 [Deltaproteobacteria bacterium HGW-Deltaproteobacteria-14]
MARPDLVLVGLVAACGEGDRRVVREAASHVAGGLSASAERDVVAHADRGPPPERRARWLRQGPRGNKARAEGAYDLMGNLHEWVDDADGTFRGGFYMDPIINGEGCLYETTAHDAQHQDDSTGFRCCADRAAQ